MLPVVRPLSRQEAKLATRQRLLEAARAVLLAQGRDGLTTGSVTKLVGVAQPTFYVHFQDMDELLRELATEIVGTLRQTLYEARAPLRGNPTDLVADSREAYRQSIRAVVGNAALLRIFLAEQYHPQSTLGACSQQLLRALTDDLVADIAHLPITFGLGPDKLGLVAEAVVGLILQMGQALADQRVTDEEAVVDLLAHTTVALVASLPR